MYSRMAIAFTALLAWASLAGAQPDGFVRLFDGRSLDGWEGDRRLFRVSNGAIVGGTLRAPIAHNEFLCTTRTYADFELVARARLRGRGDNAGIQFRSRRIADTPRVAGYQADVGYIAPRVLAQISDRVPADVLSRYPVWGSLYDESRRNRYLAVGERGAVERVLRPEDWNEIAIRALGPSIEVRLNGVVTASFVEKSDVPSSGVICLQVHEGAPMEVDYRDLRLRILRGPPR